MNILTRNLAIRFVWPVVAGLLLATLWVALTSRDGATRGPVPLGLSPAEPAVQDDPQVELALPVETYEIFLSRDPFRPLTPVAGSTGGTDGGGTTGGTTAGTTGDGTTDGTTGTTTGTTGTTGTTTGDDGCSGDGEVVCDGHVVTLVDVFVDNDGAARAQVQVDSTIYTVGVDDTFAENFLVRAIDPPCVTLAFGDETFNLCEGDRVLK